MNDNTATITELKDENQETEVVENYKEKLRPRQEKKLPEKKPRNLKKKIPKYGKAIS